MNDQGHTWINDPRFGNHTFCRKCTVIKRADGQNKPCTGVVKMAPLETEIGYWDKGSNDDPQSGNL